MSIVLQIHELTLELIETLDTKEIDRDEKIQKVEQGLEKRQVLMTKLVPPYSAEEMQRGTELISLNQKLDSLMKKEKALIQKDIKDLSVKKATNTKYVNPYQNLSTDGMFYDKKK